MEQEPASGNTLTTPGEKECEFLGMIPDVTVPLKLSVDKGEEFQRDQVGHFQRQALYQNFPFLQGVKPSALPSPMLTQVYICQHASKKHYARNMCHNCYHNKGKLKRASACAHTDKPHYSSGLCQTCYLAKYYLKRKEKRKQIREKAKAAKRREEQERS